MRWCDAENQRRFSKGELVNMIHPAASSVTIAQRPDIKQLMPNRRDDPGSPAITVGSHR